MRGDAQRWVRLGWFLLGVFFLSPYVVVSGLVAWDEYLDASDIICGLKAFYVEGAPPLVSVTATLLTLSVTACGVACFFKVLRGGAGVTHR